MDETIQTQACAHAYRKIKDPVWAIETIQSKNNFANLMKGIHVMVKLNIVSKILYNNLKLFGFYLELQMLCSLVENGSH